MRNVLFFLVFLPNFLFAQTQIQDTDGDTKVQTEATPNSNIISFSTNGGSRMNLSGSVGGSTLLQVFDNNENLFLGLNAGLNATGRKNTIIGQSTGFSLSTGANNTFIGHAAGSGTTTGTFNTAIGLNALFVNTTGHSNVSIGYASLQSNLTGQQNVAIGDFALSNNTSSFNTAVGSSALSLNSTGNNNVAVGRQSIQSNSTGSFNTALGTESLRDNTIGGSNTAIGNLALAKNITSTGNTAVGANALTNNNGGSLNTALGLNALSNNTIGASLSAGGRNALLQNTTGNSNTAFGASALQNNTSGSGNTGFGIGAGQNQTANMFCTFLGNDADNVTASSFNNSMALGRGSRITANNQVRIGNSSVTSIGGFANWTNVSDGRIKQNVRENVPGLDFILKLRPVTYNLDIAGIADRFETDFDTASLAKSQQIQTGFIAQEVEKAAKAVRFEFSGVDAPQNDEDLYGLRYAEFVVPMVKAIQEQQTMIEAQQAQIEALKALVNQMVATKNSDAPPSNFQIWPNPTGDILNISVSDIAVGTQINILSEDSKVLMTKPAKIGTQIIDLKALPTGTYFIQMLASGQAPVVKTVIKS